MTSLDLKYDQLIQQIESSQTMNQERFQDLQKKIVALSQFISSSDSFSNNETINDIPTNALKFLLIGYEHAKFVDHHGMIMFNPSLGSEKRNKFRLIILRIVEDLLATFLTKINNIEILLNHNGEVLPTFKHLKKWIDIYLDLKQTVRTNEGVNGFIKLDELEKKVYSNSGAMGRREAKIEKWQLEKGLRDDVKKLDEINRIQNNKKSIAENNDADEDDDDDNEIRSLWVKKVQLTIVETISLLESTVMEREMLERMLKGDVDLRDSGLSIDGLTKIQEEKSDNRVQRGAFDKGYTDKVEILDQNKPLLSKEGKVLRPFTIVASHDKRKEFKSKVFGTGQELPTMTVEELVDYEMANGGMVKPEEPEQEPDEDDNEYQDKETYRLREWDDFTDTHKKGSGNKMGNLG